MNWEWEKKEPGVGSQEKVYRIKKVKRYQPVGVCGLPLGKAADLTGGSLSQAC